MIMKSYESVYVFLPLIPGMQSACAALYRQLWPVWLYCVFPHYLINGTIFRKKILTLRRLMSYIYIYIYMEHPFLMFLDHTQRRSTVGRTPLDEWSARRRDLYLTTHDTHNRQFCYVHSPSDVAPRNVLSRIVLVEFYTSFYLTTLSVSNII